MVYKESDALEKLELDSELEDSTERGRQVLQNAQQRLGFAGLV